MCPYREKAKRQAAEQKRAEKAQKRDAAKAQQAEPAAADGEQNVEPEAVEEEQSHSDEEGAGTSSRLDPSLFAEVFAKPVSAPKSILKKRSAEEAADEVARLQRERKQKRKLQRAGGVVRGNDGLPMKRTQDGTVLRALSSTGSSNHKTTFDDDEDEPEEPLDVIVRPERLDRTTSLPNAKARAFRKRSMAKRSSASKTNASAKNAAGKKAKDEDDLWASTIQLSCPVESFTTSSTRATRPRARSRMAKLHLRHAKPSEVEAFAKTPWLSCVLEAEAVHLWALLAANRTRTTTTKAPSFARTQILYLYRHPRISPILHIF